MFTRPKPRFRDFFKTDIAQNIRNQTNNLSIPMFLPGLLQECVMYATDMCIEFQKQSDGLLTSDWIDHITNEVCAVFLEFFPSDFGTAQVSEVIDQVQTIMRTPSDALLLVNEYYNRC